MTTIRKPSTEIGFAALNGAVVPSTTPEWWRRAGNIRVGHRRHPNGQWHIVLATLDDRPIAEMSVSAARTLARTLRDEVYWAGARARQDRQSVPNPDEPQQET